MAFKMRINFVDVIKDESLKSLYINDNKVGFEFLIRLSDYRGAYLSCIERFELFVDGEKYPEELVRLCLNDKEFIFSQLPSLTSEYWFLLDEAKVKVIDLKGLEKGNHEIDLKLEFRIPYLPSDETESGYMTLDASGNKVLEVK